MSINDGEWPGLARRQSYGMRNTTLTTTRTIERILFAFGGIAIYNMVELMVQIPLRFKAWKGLYFWSLLISAIGILPYVLGLLFKFFGVIQGYPLVYLAITMIDLGWQMMVTGQSFVLYSRLHLVCRNRKIQKAVLWVMIANWFVSNVPTTVFVFGASSPHPERYMIPYGVWERLQLCLYFTQEVGISCIYGVEVVKMLKPEFFEQKADTNASRKSTTSSQEFGKRMRSSTANTRIMRHLLWVNVIIIVLDITLLVVEFVGHYEVQVMYKAFVYSVKLRLEFRILNQLTDIAQSRLRSSQAYFGDGDGPIASGSSGSQWEPLTSADTRRPSTRPMLSPLSSNDLGVLPDIEKNALPVASGANSERKDSVMPNHNDLRKESHVPPLPNLDSCLTGRTSLNKSRRPTAVGVVSFTEGFGPSTRSEEDELQTKWNAMVGRNE